MRHIAFICVLIAAPTAGAQIWQLTHEAGEPGNHFGSAIAIDGDRAIVGASGENVCGANSGAVYVYERAGAGGFAEVARVTPSSCRAGTFFGRAVALSGEVAVVAADGDPLDPNDPNVAFVFIRGDDGQWREVDVLTPDYPGPEGPFAAAISIDGDRIVVTAAGDTGHRRYHGAAYVFERSDAGSSPAWERVARLQPEKDPRLGIFGSDVSLDGHRMAVTASPYRNDGTGGVFVYERGTDGRWHERYHVEGLAAHTVRAALAGSILVVGEPQAGPKASGHVSVFGRSDDGRWRRQSTLTADVPYRFGAFGSLVAVARTPVGPRVLAVGYTEQLGRQTNIDRVVHVFGYDAVSGWVQRQILDMGDWAFGMAIALDGQTAVVGRAADHIPGSAYAIQLVE